jgi:hypothetical protein
LAGWAAAAGSLSRLHQTVDMWSAHRIPQLHFHLSKPDRYFFIQVTTQFIRSRGWVDPVPLTGDYPILIFTSSAILSTSGHFIPFSFIHMTEQASWMFLSHFSM